MLLKNATNVISLPFLFFIFSIWTICRFFDRWSFFRRRER